MLLSHPGYTCVEPATGRVIDWNPEDLTERSGDRAWQRSFSELAGSIPEWLGDWLRQPTPQELAEAAREQWAVEHARRSREILAAMSPEERRKLGLPDEGWEEVAWGGNGLEPDEPSPAG